MIIGFQEEEAQNTLWRDGLWRGGDYFMERMVSERDNFMLWATAIKCRNETCCRFARHLHSNRPFVHTKMDLNNYMLHLILSISNQNHPFYHSGCDGSLNIRCLQSSAFSGIATSGGLGLISRISGRKKSGRFKLRSISFLPISPRSPVHLGEKQFLLFYGARGSDLSIWY